MSATREPVSLVRQTVIAISGSAPTLPFIERWDFYLILLDAGESRLSLSEEWLESQYRFTPPIKIDLARELLDVIL